MGSTVKKYAKGRGKKDYRERAGALYKFREPATGLAPSLMGPPIMTIASVGYIKLNKKQRRMRGRTRSVTTICFHSSWREENDDEGTVQQEDAAPGK